MDSLLAFLNTGFGVMLSASILGAIGLFTWQRMDWVFKERYHRAQVLLDRQLDLVEGINKDVGKFVALADSISAPILKGPVPQEQTDDAIRAYNEYQATWFGTCEAHKALLAFYLSNETVEAFAGVVKATEDLDVSLTNVRTREGAWKAYEAGRAVHTGLREWNTAVVGRIKNGRA